MRIEMTIGGREKSMKRILSALLAISLCATLAISLTGCRNKDGDEFVAPENYTSVIRVTINPTVDLYLDANDVILAVEYVNEDAKVVYEDIKETLVGADLKTGVDLVIEKAADKGFLVENKEVKIDLVEAKEETKQNAVLKIAVDAAKAILQEKVPEAAVSIQLKGEAVDEETLAAAVPGEDLTGTTVAATAAATQATAVATAAPTKAPTAAPTAAPTKAAELKYGVRYTCYLQFAEDSMVACSYNFNESTGRCTFTEVPYLEESMAGMPGTVEFNGLKWAKSGGGLGDSIAYTLSGSTVTLTEEGGGASVTFAIGNNKLTVQSVSGNFFGEREFKVGDVFEIK